MTPLATEDPESPPRGRPERPERPEDPATSRPCLISHILQQRTAKILQHICDEKSEDGISRGLLTKVGWKEDRQSEGSHMPCTPHRCGVSEMRVDGVKESLTIQEGQQKRKVSPCSHINLCKQCQTPCVIEMEYRVSSLRILGPKHSELPHHAETIHGTGMVALRIRV